MASSPRYARIGSPRAGTKTLEQLMSAYKSLLQTEVERDKEILYMQTLQSQNELVQMLHLEKQKLSTDLDESKRKNEELQKENHSFRSHFASNRLQSNYSQGPQSQYTTQTLKELSRVLSPKGNVHHLPPVTGASPPPTLEAMAAEEDLKGVKGEQKTLWDTLDKFKIENEELKQEIASVEASKAQLSQQLDNGLKAVKQEKMKFQETVRKLELENQQLKKQLTSVQASKVQLNQQVDDIERTLQDTLQGLDAAQKETESVKEEKEKLKEEICRLRSSGYGQTSRFYSGFGSPRPPPQKTVSVQLVSRHTASHGDMLRDLAGQVTASLLQQNIRVDFVHSEAASPARPLVVACLRALRLGTDVNEALSGINRDSSVGLVVLHHQGPHVRHCDVTEKQLSSETCELGLVVDVVFWKDRHLYDSDINSAALTRLCSYLAQFAQ